MNELDEHYANANRIIPALVDLLRKAPFFSLRPSERDWESLVEIAILIRNTLSSANLASEERSLVGVLLQKLIGPTSCTSLVISEPLLWNKYYRISKRDLIVNVQL